MFFNFIYVLCMCQHMSMVWVYTDQFCGMYMFCENKDLVGLIQCHVQCILLSKNLMTSITGIRIPFEQSYLRCKFTVRTSSFY